MIKINHRVYYETKYLGCNVGCVLTQEGAALIDTPAFPEAARELRGQIGELGSKKPACTILTHEHFDHVMGSAYLTPNIYAHQAAVAELRYLQKNLAKEITSFFPDLYKACKATIDATEVVLPHITFTGAMSLTLGDTLFDMSYAGGHSPASILVHLPQEKVLFCGDLADKGMPFVTPYSNFDEWIHALRRIEALQLDAVVPGHGEVCTLEEVRKTRIYFEALMEKVTKLVEADIGQEETMHTVNVDKWLPVEKDATVTQRVTMDAALMWAYLAEYSEEEE